MKDFDVLKYKMWKSNSKKASKFSFFEFISLNWLILTNYFASGKSQNDYIGMKMVSNESL